MNSIFLLSTGDSGYDTYSGAVLIARDAKEAEKLWADAFVDACSRPSFQGVVKIGVTHKKAQIVLTSFHAG